MPPMETIARASGAVATAIFRAVREYLAQHESSAFVEQRVHDPEDPATWVGLDYVHDRVLAQLDQQSKLWEEADARLRLVLGIIGIVFAVTLGLLPRGTAVGGPLLLPFFVGVLAIVGLVLFAVAGLIAVVAYWPRDFNRPPAPASLRKYITTNEREIKLTVVDEMLDAYDENAAWLGRKFLAFRWALAIGGLATAVLGGSVIIELAEVTRAWG
jgi:hypothetical protein